MHILDSKTETRVRSSQRLFASVNLVQERCATTFPPSLPALLNPIMLQSLARIEDNQVQNRSRVVDFGSYKSSSVLIVAAVIHNAIATRVSLGRGIVEAVNTGM